jgi:hypothetical protein
VAEFPQDPSFVGLLPPRRGKFRATVSRFSAQRKWKIGSIMVVLDGIVDDIDLYVSVLAESTLAKNINEICP